MTSKVAINLSSPPDALLNKAIVANGFVFCSGALPVNLEEPTVIVPGDIQAHTHQVIKNLATVLDAAGSSIEHVVKVNIFLLNTEDMDAVNVVYKQYWGDLKPCRSCVTVKELPRGSDIEIECTAILKEKAKL